MVLCSFPDFHMADELESMELQVLREQALSTQVTWSLYGPNPIRGSTRLQVRQI